MRTIPRFLRFLFLVPLVFAVFAVFIYVVMRLWNWLMPDLFGLHTITYWQALGILILSKILFGGFFGGRGGYPTWRTRRRIIERWERMTPEEQERFRQGLHGRWFGSGPGEPSVEPKP